jgi:hypothetical protein
MLFYTQIHMLAVHEAVPARNAARQCADVRKAQNEQILARSAWATPAIPSMLCSRVMKPAAALPPDRPKLIRLRPNAESDPGYRPIAPRDVNPVGVRDATDIARTINATLQ